MKKLIEAAWVAGINTHKFEGLSRQAQKRRIAKAIASKVRK